MYCKWNSFPVVKGSRGAFLKNLYCSHADLFGYLCFLLLFWWKSCTVGCFRPQHLIDDESLLLLN